MFTAASIVLLTGITNANAASANPLDLADVPLFLQGSADPAIAISFDTTPDTKNAYVFFNETLGNLNSLPGKKKFLAAPFVNIIYYNPANQYPPPLRADGTPFKEHPFTATCVDGFVAELDPASAVCGIDLTSAYKLILHYNQTNGQSNYNEDGGGPPNPQHAFYNKYIGPISTHPTDPSLDEPDYNDIKDNNNYVKVLIPPAEQQNFSNWYAYYKTRNMLVRSAATRAFGIMDEGFKISWQTFKDAFIPNNMLPMKGQHRLDFWQWLLELDVQGSGKLDAAMARAGELFQQDQTYLEDGVGTDLLSCQQNFHVVLVNDRSVGNYPGGTANVPIIDNETQIATLGDDSTPFNSADPEAAIYYDPESKTTADSAFTFWAKDLMPNLANGVPRYLSSFSNAAGTDLDLLVGEDWWDTTTTTGNALFWNDKNDPANWQHMVNFIVGLGIRGFLEPNTAKHDPRKGTQTDYQKLRDGSIPWGDPAPTGQITPIKYTDSLWHAAVNSRGAFVAATSPQELVDAFKELINHLFTRRSGSSSASTISGNILTTNTNVFKTSFDVTDWSGSVVAQRLTEDGSFGEIIWDAACNLTGGICGSTNTFVPQHHAPNARTIFAYDPLTKQTNKFFNSSLNNNQKAMLDQSVLVANSTATREELVNYLRGDRSNEISDTNPTGFFRHRRVLLGDVIHSSAIVVRGPRGGYPEKFAPGFTAFVEANKARKNIVLVGANDGMLHAFDTENGNELWAFIPSQSLNNMHLLADPIYGHQNYVDASPIITDVEINGTWRTIALGGMRLGGQSYYALDITNPISPTVLWEFGDTDDPDMGYSYNESFVARLKDGTWVGFLPNGYNSIVNDNHVGTGHSVLYMIDLATGAKLAKFDTGEGDLLQSNGMAGPVVSDAIFDLDAEMAYVGDLKGDIYKIDLTGATIDNSSMTKLITSVNDYKTSITTPLRLTRFNDFPGLSGVMVTFGTGKFIEIGDKSIVEPQYIASIFADHPTATYPIDILDTNVVEQIATDDVATGIRTITNNEVTIGSDFGWRMKLIGEGERIVAKMTKRRTAKFLIYSTYLPTGGSACSSGGSSVVSVIDWRTGGPPKTGSLLKNGNADGIYIENQVFGVTPLGLAGGGGERLILGTDEDTNNNGNGIGGEQEVIIIPDFTWRRRSWQRLFPDG